jgi:cytochrome b
VIRVWDRLVRSLHWLLAAAAGTAWASGHWQPRHFDAVHHTAGYVCAAAVLLRLLWGVAGSRYARLRQFVRGPQAVWAYARALRAGHEPRYIGHNPLGGWMVLALWTCAAALSLSGFLYTTDWLWGYAWLENLHALLAWGLMALVIGHLGGVAMTSRRHREHLVAAMLTGDKRAAAPGDVA